MFVEEHHSTINFCNCQEKFL